MHINIPFIVLTFIIIIAVILLSDTLISAMLIVSLLANFLAIVSHFGNLTKNMLGFSIQDWGKPEDKTNNEEKHDKPEEKPLEDQNTMLYDPDYEIWNSYRKSYTDCYPEPQAAVGTSCAETGYGIDTMNALYAQRRARDKKCSDGCAVRSAEAFRHHFGSEFEDCENKVWWSKYEV